MFELDKKVVSEEILEAQFLCDLNACKGACCVQGNAGAPLEIEETHVLESIYEQVRPYLRPEGIRAIEKQGKYIVGEDGEWETPLVENEECAYVVFTEDGTALCGIEQAYLDGATDWKKPISCHLYPVRIQEYSQLTAVNYHRWEICDPACGLGAAMKMPVYKFVKEALIRKFGEAWYQELEKVAAGLSDSRDV